MPCLQRLTLMLLLLLLNTTCWSCPSHVRCNTGVRCGVESMVWALCRGCQPVHHLRQKAYQGRRMYVHVDFIRERMFVVDRSAVLPQLLFNQLEAIFSVQYNVASRQRSICTDEVCKRCQRCACCVLIDAVRPEPKYITRSLNSQSPRPGFFPSAGLEQ